MKKQLLLLILTLLPMVTWAESVEIDGIYYNLIEKAKVAEVTSSPNKYTGDIIIPENVNFEGVEYTVSSINVYAFAYCKELVSIIIPKSITCINNGVFCDCASLKSVTMPENITSIGNKAFSGCTALTNIEIPINVTTIGEQAFMGCTNLRSISIPNSVNSIGDEAFCYCKCLSTITIPNNITSIQRGVFLGCEALTSISIPNSVNRFEHLAFSCTGLTSINIPNSVNFIGSKAFGGCTNLTSISIPTGVTSIETETFDGCTSLSSITIPNSVKSICSGAFYGCTSLTNFTISDFVTNIDAYAFSGCSNLKTLTIGKTVNKIRERAFAECKSLESIICFAENVPSTDVSAFENSYIEYATLHVPASSVDAYKAADPWKNFKEISYIEGTWPVVIDGLKYEIEDDWAVVVGRNEDYHDVVIPEKKTYKDKEYKVRVEQGTNYNSGKRGAFCEDEGIYSYTDPYITSTAYSNLGGICYHAINLKKISCASLTSIEGGHVTATYHTAFAECSSLEEIDMPNLQRIGDIAFVGCNSLKAIDFPKLQYVEDCAFRGTSLQSVNLPELLNASTMAFANCSSLKTIVVDKVESLGTRQHSSSSMGGTFLNCTSLEEVVLPNIISMISSSDYYLENVCGNFEGCTSLKKVELGSKCEIIDKSTFKGCTALSQIYSHSITPPTLEPSAFDESTYSSATLMVHATAYNEYKSTYPWSLFKNITTIEPLYKLTYMVDGTIYKEEELAEGMIITPEAWPTKEGYTFSGWNDIPETMPAHDVVVTGTFIQNEQTTEFTVDDVTYDITGEGTVTIVGSDQKGDVEIQSTIDINGHTFYVTAIGYSAFKDNLDMTSLTIPEGVTTIGSYAFEGCLNLTLINIGKDVLNIGSMAFANIGTAAAARTRGESPLVVNCYSEKVPDAEYDAFLYTPIEDATLLVNDNLLDEYRMTAPWCYFGKIMGFEEAAGIKSISIDSANARIYDMQGNRLDNPQKGVNIIRYKDGKVKKVMVK